MIEYFCLRTKSDLSYQHNSTTIIEKTVQSIIQIAPEALFTRDHLVREACSATLRAHTYARFPKRADISVVFQKFDNTGCDSFENSLAFAAHLGLASVVRQLLENGVQDTKSDFGFASHCFVRHRDPRLTSIYLQMKLDLSVKQAKGKPTDCFLLHNNHFCTAKSSRRGISIHHYESLIRHATAYGSLETVKCLIDALCDDEADFEKCSCTTFLSCEYSPNHWIDLRTAAQNLMLVTAATSGHFDMAQAALENGANANCNVRGFVRMPILLQPILSCVANRGDKRIFELLLCYGADMWRRTRRPLLSCAVHGGCLEIVEFCLRSGMTNFSRSTTEPQGCGAIHPLQNALLHRPFEICHEILRLFCKYGVMFAPDSELDQKLCEEATKRGDTGSLNILKEMREEGRAPELQESPAFRV